MWVKASKCPKCGGRLTFEAIGNFGDLYDINARTGKVNRTRNKRIHYEHSGEVMIYCSSCGTNYDYRLKVDGSYQIASLIDEGEAPKGDNNG